VEFGLLGPLVVRAGDVPVVVSASKQRVLLAALLLRANEVVAAAELAEAVWEGCPPETARVTLQNYVKRLRHVLGPAGYERIVTRPAGYVIEVGPGELDVARFSELRAGGLAAARAGAWEAAVGQLGAALELWRGQPLADVPSQVLAVAEVPRLAGMRLETAEARIDAELHLGRHHEVVGELQALTAAEPARERLHELLMLALYRSGQQAGALAAYRLARRQLIDKLGIEPGPGLRELNQKILRSDRALLPAPPAPSAAPAAPAPAAAAGRAAARPASDGAAASGNGGGRVASMLPAGVAGFAGRSAELAALSAMPGRGGAPVLITAIGGTAGVGKTALAVHWARQHAAWFPDGQLYANLRGFGPADPLPAAEALRAFLDAVGVPAAQIPASLDGRRAVYRSALAGKKILILLDNARDPAQVRPLLPASPTATVVITSRNDLASLVVTDGAQPITLDVLTDTEAHQMLAQRLGPPRLTAEPAAARELITLCARLPLALAITAARAAAHPTLPLSALATELRNASTRLDALATTHHTTSDQATHTTSDEATDARAVLSWSYQQLAPPTARTFRLLALHPGPDITAPATASLTGTDPPHATRQLRELTRGCLLTEHTPGRYALHDLLRAYATEQTHTTDHPQTRHHATTRILDHYLHTAHTAALVLNPAREPVTLPSLHPGVTPERFCDERQALAWFEAEHRVLTSAISLAAETGFDACAWQLPRAMAEFLNRQGHWHEQAANERIAVAVTTRIGDVAGQAMSRRLLAGACARLGDYGQAHAHYAACLRLYRQLGDRVGEARIHQSLSWVAEHQGDHRAGLDHAEQALALFQAVGHQAGHAAALNAVGFCHALLGDYEQARAFCRQALDLNRQLGIRHGEAATWDSLGYAEHHLGRYREATECYRHALSLFREAGDRFSEAEILTHLGDTRQAAGDHREAHDAWQHALAILDDLHHPDAGPVRARLAAAPPPRACGARVSPGPAVSAERTA
jgi:DNA-binding SARP family transcriptional activator/tetratricopeptide (TPR) repeat protein